MKPTRLLTLGEHRIAVHERGEGPQVVFVHGTPSSAYEFEAAMQDLAADHRCIAMDHLGFGRSDKPTDADYSVVGHQRRLAQVLDALDLRDALFVLHDFGTSFALPWMQANRDRVRGVVLCNTFLWPAEGAMRWVLRFYASRLGRWLYRRLNLSAGVLLPWAWGRRRPLTSEVHQRFLEPFAQVEERYATSALPGELVGTTLQTMEPASLGGWAVRGLWGMADPMVGAAELARWREALPHLEVVELEDAGHFVAHEAPEELAAIVRRFVA